MVKVARSAVVMVKWLCMLLKQRVITFWKKLRSYPKKYTIPGSVALVFGLLYATIFFIDKPVAFSYAGSTCVKYLTLFPDTQKSASDSYVAKPAQLLKIGSVPIIARSVCFTPTEPPEQGISTVRLSPGGGLFMRKTFAIEVGSLPSVRADTLSKPVPLSRPLSVPLSDTDTVFSYQVKVADVRADCSSKDKRISCDVKKLGLLQGKPYTIEILRLFKGKRVAVITKKDITTLSAAHVVESSVKPAETVFAKLKAFDFVFDKPIVKANAVLNRIENGVRTPTASSLTITDMKAQLTVTEDLPRSMDYELIIDAVEAADGSGLEAAHVLSFRTSGGPKVTGISIGRSGVAIGATAVITFDQTLLEAQDVSKFMTTAGGAALSGKKGNQLFISLAGVPKCGDFSIKLTNDLQSNFEIAGNSAWNFASRTICHTVGTVGYSSKGRPINAYYFGSGPSTVLYTGAIHGNELGTRTLMNNWIDDLEANAHSIPANKSVVVVPQINPDGVASGTRVNGRNVDLNRNFATSDWQKDITTVNNQPFPGGGGASAMSEPETQAIAGLASRLRPAIVLSYHSQGSIVAANQAGNSNALAAMYSQLSGYRNTTGQSGTTFEYAISGTADDWYAERLGVGSILIELGSHGSAQFGRNQKAMWAMLNNS